MGSVIKRYCDWCGKEIEPSYSFVTVKLFPRKARYYLYKGYGTEISDSPRDAFDRDDFVCQTCANTIKEMRKMIKSRAIKHEEE